jgi:hypothetical protein
MDVVVKPLYSQGKRTMYPFYNLDGPQASLDVILKVNAPLLPESNDTELPMQIYKYIPVMYNILGI